MIKGYDYKEAESITGVVESTLRYWVDQGIIDPGVAQVRKDGREGRRKLFSLGNLFEVALLKWLGEKVGLQDKAKLLKQVAQDRRAKDFFSPAILAKEKAFLLIHELKDPVYTSALGDVRFMASYKKNDFKITPDHFENSVSIFVFNINDQYKQFQDKL